MNFEHLTVLQTLLSLFIGLGLGLVYMYLLWKTVLYLPKAAHKGRLLFISAVLRIFFLIFFATILSFGETSRFLLIIIGFIIARLLVERQVKKSIQELTKNKKKSPANPKRNKTK